MKYIAKVRMTNGLNKHVIETNGPNTNVVVVEEIVPHGKRKGQISYYIDGDRTWYVSIDLAMNIHGGEYVHLARGIVLVEMVKLIQFEQNRSHNEY